MDYILGLDLGTSSLKGLVLTTDGKFVYETSEYYPLITKEKGYSEQNPKEWIIAAKKVIKTIVENVDGGDENIKAISFSGQMHSLVVIDKNYEVLHNAILWNDVRTTEECRDIEKTLGQSIVDITKNKALEGFTLPKILWIKKHKPEIFENIYKFMMPKDYLSFYLTGEIFTDYSDASGTLLLDIEKNIWSEEILNAFSINKDICPKILNSTDFVANMKKDVALDLGLKNAPKIYAGAADNAAAAVSAGIFKKGVALSSIGTSGVFLSYEDENNKGYNGNLHLFCHAIKGKYYSMGVTLSAGNSLDWYKNNFYENSTFDEMIEETKKIKNGSDGLIFAPYIMGERTPHTNSSVRGSFVGIDINHTKPHFTKAVMEGITFSLNDCKNLMTKNIGGNNKIEKIISTGGGAKSQTWLQMQADIFDSDIYLNETGNGPDMGCALIAIIGFTGSLDILSSIKTKKVASKKDHGTYEEAYKKYTKIYELTKNL